jgi:polyhydroxybutyrate depolymerase
MAMSASRALAALAVLLPCTFARGQESLERHLNVGGRERSYLIDLPPRDTTRRPLPVVLVFHGGGGSPAGARTQTGFSTLAAGVRAIVVYPAGSGRLSDARLLTWNTGTCCGYAKAANIDDAAFISALLDTLQRTYPIDKNRVFATGLSNGGMMSYLVACRLADRIAAVAVVSGELSMNCSPSRPVSVLIIHGTADENLPFNGGVGAKALDKHEVRPVSYALDSWKRFDRCPDAALTSSHDGVTHSTWSPCSAGTAVELYKIESGGHAWPGGERMSRILDAPSNALDATQTAWAFFMAHPRATAPR